MGRIRPAKKMTCALLLPLWCMLANGVHAEDEPERDQRSEEPRGESELLVPGARRATPPPRGESDSVGIESLLQLPDGFITNSPRSVAGASEAEWRRRFKKADSALTEARTSLAKTKRELDSAAVGGGSSQWSVAPPGGGGNGGGGGPNASTSPLSFRLRQQVREDRERIESTEKAMRELRIEADLAGVPESWRSGVGEAAATDS